MRSIFHLSFPVRDLDEAVDFYVAKLRAVAGRREERWADLALFGAQITLHHAPSDVTVPMPRTRHFGVTLSWSDWHELTEGLADFVEHPAVSHHGSEREQAKALVSDPSGNLIEIKAYRQPEAVLPGLAAHAS